MPEQHLFEYAIIRVVPHVEREEFLNVGVVLYCATLKFLKAKFGADKELLTSFSGKLDFPDVEGYLNAFERICAGGSDAGPIAKLPVAERFRWLTATRSTVVQTSKVHPGLLCGDPAEMLDRLYQQMVVR